MTSRGGRPGSSISDSQFSGVTAAGSAPSLKNRLEYARGCGSGYPVSWAGRTQVWVRPSGWMTLPLDLLGVAVAGDLLDDRSGDVEAAVGVLEAFAGPHRPAAGHRHPQQFLGGEGVEAMLDEPGAGGVAVD